MGVYAVTGGTGFLGEHLVSQLAARGHQVRVLARTAPALLPRLPADRRGGVEPVTGSVLDPAALSEAFRGVDGVFHLAASVTHSREAGAATATTDLAVAGVDGVLEASAAAGASRVVLVSTSGVQAVSFNASSPPADETAPFARDIAGRWPYYASKMASESRGRRGGGGEGEGRRRGAYAPLHPTVPHRARLAGRRGAGA